MITFFQGEGCHRNQHHLAGGVQDRDFELLCFGNYRFHFYPTGSNGWIQLNVNGGIFLLQSFLMRLGRVPGINIGSGFEQA